MILVDTPIWIDHLREKDHRLAGLVMRGQVLCHPLIIAELAMGSLKDRATTLFEFEDLARSHHIELDEVRALVEREKLYSRGIGVIDATLIASCLQQRGTLLWTRDKRLNAVAEHFGIAYQPLH